mmetsp:Transcript_29042/g.40870  ORF Transcript_29042/g.40870 Transcript_29042/m.40870 type:complete len:538 (-) Transcript_29042:393-2006(-)
MYSMDITVELMRKDRVIEEQQRRIVQLEMELDRCRKQIDELLYAKEKLTKAEPKVEDKAQSRYWTPEEHQRFLEAVKKFGLKDVKAVASYVGTRNPTQVRTHAQKYYLRLERERNKQSGEFKLDDHSSAAENVSDKNDEKKSKKSKTKSDSRDVVVHDDSEGVDSSPPTADMKPSLEGITDKVVPIVEDENKKTKKAAAKKKPPLPNIAEVQALLAKTSPNTNAPVTTPATTVSTTPLGTSAPVPDRAPQGLLGLAANTGSYADSHRAAVTQALAAETADAVLSILKSWTLQEYTSFVEGLVTYGNERDINRRCRMISERFLPKYTPEEIRHCYLILQSHVAQTKSKNATKDTPSPPIAAPPGYTPPGLGHDFGVLGKRPRTSPPTHYFDNQQGGMVPITMPSAMNPYDALGIGYRYPSLGGSPSPPTNPLFGNTPPGLLSNTPPRLFLSPLNTPLSEILNNPTHSTDTMRPSMDPFYFGPKSEALPFESNRRAELDQQSDFTDPAFFGGDVSWENSPGGEIGQDYQADNFAKTISL